ncbi:hypothetical protein DB30_03665 [Enhygromyxa salina]|uniref:DUF2961 domain-containing protein n=1 Tax=Enhygromyxa salina TaxID=215803 RepID=A0A0C2A0Y8_9BACT|nr:DUF2961 domain-containing protein [Enhygromyxa salina]KIG17068.1 hypothetical protein DB30_03665 [Enhygromyxa salina]
MARRSGGLVLAALASILACDGAPPPRDAIYFLERLHLLDTLPLLEPGDAELASTYDRDGHNALDGMTYPWTDGRRNVLLSVDGPGCIHRISTGDIAAVADTRVEIMLDYGELLSMTVGELFDPISSPFAGGLIHSGPYPDVHYPTVRMPMPFAEHAEVRLIDADQRWGVFWQIGYTRYEAGTPIETLTLPLDPGTERALDEAGQAWADAVAGARRPQSPSVRVSESLEPGADLSWDDSGCGTIERLAVGIDPGDASAAAAWRALRLRVIWDRANSPAIELPLAEFMGAGDNADDPEAAFNGLIMSATEHRADLRLPMPYREAARIELHNDGEAPVEAELELWTRRCVNHPVNAGYLHAHAQTAPAATPNSPRSGPAQVPVHRLFDYQGRGKLVGVLLRIEWPFADLWWGEGDWQIWSDQPVNAWPPRYHGTGTEEFFDAGWTRFDRRPLAGAIKQRPGLVSVYGFMLNDAFTFEQQLRVQVETVGLWVGDLVVTELHPTWSSTVYWYDERP